MLGQTREGRGATTEQDIGRMTPAGDTEWVVTRPQDQPIDLNGFRTGKTARRLDPVLKLLFQASAIFQRPACGDNKTVGDGWVAARRPRNDADQCHQPGQDNKLTTTGLETTHQDLAQSLSRGMVVDRADQFPDRPSSVTFSLISLPARLTTTSTWSPGL